LIGAGAALLIAVVLAAPIVVRGGNGGSPGGSCVPTLRYRGRTYVARSVSTRQAVEAIAIGVGVASGCGAAPANVDLRSLAGIRPADAVGVTADQSSIYVRRGVCRRSTPADLVTCLRQNR
jgi:hypothetical protein